MKLRNTTNEYTLLCKRYSEERSWKLLEDIHILSQPYLISHYHIHFLMLKKALGERNIKEFFGQFFRICLFLPENFFMILPKNNPGTTRVSALKSFE